MKNISKSVLKSAHRLRSLVLVYWFSSSLLFAFFLGLIDLVERHREVINDAEHTRDFVNSTFSIPLSAANRQSLIYNYSKNPRVDESDGLNILFLVDSFGKIVYSSLPAARDLSIADPQLQRTETNDPDFNAVVSCFKESNKSCVEISSSDFLLRLGSFSIVRPIEIPSGDIGLPSKKLLLVLNYDPGVVFVGFAQDLIFVILFSLLSSGLLSFLLWYVLSSRLLPELSEEVNVDGLTQLFNRSLFMERAKEILANAEQENGELIMAVIDIDYFKRINDTYGHVVGDTALVHVADVFRAVTRPEDLVCRFGGEEFAVLLGANRENGIRALERLRLQLEMAKLNIGGHNLQITASIGAAFTGQCGYNLDYLYGVADKALYVAKQSGRNRVEWGDGRTQSRLFR